MFDDTTANQFADSARALNRDPRRAALDEAASLAASRGLHRTAARVARGELSLADHPEVGGLLHLGADVLEAFAAADAQDRRELLRRFVGPPAPVVPPLPARGLRTRQGRRGREHRAAPAVACGDADEGAEPPQRGPLGLAHQRLEHRPNRADEVRLSHGRAS